MKKKMKYYLSLVMAICLSMMMLAGCSKKENEESTTTEPTPTQAPEITETEPTVAPKSTDPMDMITDGYYVYSFFAEGNGDFTQYFHFNEADPVLGSVFYAGFANNQRNFTGTYTVEKKDCNYEAFATRDDLVAKQNIQTGTAPYTVTFYDWDGNVLDSCAFDGTILYNDMEDIKASGSGPTFYNHDIDGDASKFASTYAAEIGVAYLDFIADADAASTLTLFHNMTYVDLVSMMVEGNWSMAANANGGYDYTLTPNDAADTGAVLSVVADKSTSTYTPNGGEAIPMTNASLSGPKLAYEFDGVYHVDQYDADANLAFKLYDDGSCELIATVFDSEAAIDTGTYAIDGYTMNFTMEKAGALQSVLNNETQEMSVPYLAVGTDLGDIDAVLILNPDALASAKILFSFSGGYTTFDCNDDNTFKFAYKDYDVEETGTWAFDATSYTFTITKSDGNTITASINSDDHSLNFEYAAVVNDQLKDTFTCSSDIWGPALVK